MPWARNLGSSRFTPRVMSLDRMPFWICAWQYEGDPLASRRRAPSSPLPSVSVGQHAHACSCCVPPGSSTCDFEVELCPFGPASSPRRCMVSSSTMSTCLRLCVRQIESILVTKDRSPSAFKTRLFLSRSVAASRTLLRNCRDLPHPLGGVGTRLTCSFVIRGSRVRSLQPAPISKYASDKDILSVRARDECRPLALHQVVGTAAIDSSAAFEWVVDTFRAAAHTAWSAIYGGHVPLSWRSPKPASGH